MSTPDPRGGYKPSKSKGISPEATHAAASIVKEDEARRNVLLPLPAAVVDALLVIAEESGKSRKDVLDDLAAEAAPILLQCLGRVNAGYEMRRTERIAKALGNTPAPLRPDPEPLL